VRGFDIGLSDDSLWKLTVQHLGTAADDLGIPLVTVETNARMFLDRAGPWGLVSHGAGLAGVGHLFGEQIHQVLIPSSHNLNDLYPWGSHPLLDPLWSSDSVRFVHDGAHLTRVEKTALLAESSVALRHLRVCTRNPGGEYNCGRCEKCVRTMIGLELAGALKLCKTFPEIPIAELLALLWVTSANSASFARENLAVARQKHRADVVDALSYALWAFDAREASSRIRELVRRCPTRKLLRRALSAPRGMRHRAK
jgi:hypothetical protein